MAIDPSLDRQNVLRIYTKAVEFEWLDMPPYMPKCVAHSRDRNTPGGSTLVVGFIVLGARSICCVIILMAGGSLN